MLRLAPIAVLFALLLPVGVSNADEPLKMGLAALDRMRNGDKTDYEAIETLGAELLKAHERPQEQAQIYYQLAHVQAQSGLKHPDKIIKHAQAALDTKLLTPEQRGTLYSYLSSAHEVDSTVKDFKDRRKNAVQPLLAGLRELQGFDLPKLPPEPPTVRIFKGDFKDRGAEEEARRQVEEAIRLRAEAIRTQTLIARRDTLTSQVKWLYAREPVGDDELLELAEKAVGEETAKALVASAKSEREETAKKRKAREKQDAK